MPKEQHETESLLSLVLSVSVTAFFFKDCNFFKKQGASPNQSDHKAIGRIKSQSNEADRRSSESRYGFVGVGVEGIRRRYTHKTP